MTSETLLIEAIQQTSPDVMTRGEAEEAAQNLAGFFNLLIEIDREQHQSTPAPSEGVR